MHVRRIVTRLLFIPLLALFAPSPFSRAAPPVTAANAHFTGDPCDFTSSFSFGYDQVLACYRSVPFCPDPSNPATCDRDAQVAHLRAAIEGFSDLREIYQPVAHWRHKLDAVEKAHFKSDYDLFLAMADIMASFRDPHWSYVGPTCFEETLFALIPLEFGSMVTRVKGEEQDQQIIYLRDPYSFFSYEYATATGIDVTPFTGQRVVSINGEPPLRFFRHWARDNLRKDVDDGNNLMEIMQNEGYSLRAGSYNSFPESRSISLVLETRAGVRTHVELPWAFIPFTEFGYPGPPPASSEEFRALCFQPAVAPAAARSVTPPTHTLREPVAFDGRGAQRRAWIAALEAKYPATNAAGPRPTEFIEVPLEKQNQDIVEILPLHDGARTVAYTEDTVAIQLRSDFVQNWDDEFAAGASYACDHADRLIVDMRNNRGGYVSRGQRLAHYLNATAPALPNAVFGFRELAVSPALNELRRLSESLVSLGFPSCWEGYEAACRLKIPSGQPLNDPLWYSHVAFERRGEAIEPLTPLVTFGPTVPPESRVIPCAGKFTGKNLIMLLNGENASMGFFTPELLQGVATLVVNGGFTHEPMFAGLARGGPVRATSSFQDDADYLTDVTGIETKFRLPDLPRPIRFSIEWDAFYKPDLKHLYVDNPPYGDLQLQFWSTSHATDGAAYRTVVSAVERHALVDPFCGPPRESRSCSVYDHCARRALDAAVQHGTVSAKTAARTLEDAESACHSRGER